MRLTPLFYTIQTNYLNSFLDSYEYNWGITNYTYTGTECIGTRLAPFLAPSNTVLLFEGQEGTTPAAVRDTSSNPLAGINGNNGWEIGKSCNSPYVVGVSWHDPAAAQNSPMNRLNYLAADGHAKNLTVSTVSYSNGGVVTTGQSPDALAPGVAMTYKVDANN